MNAIGRWLSSQYNAYVDGMIRAEKAEGLLPKIYERAKLTDQSLDEVCFIKMHNYCVIHVLKASIERAKTYPHLLDNKDQMLMVANEVDQVVKNTFREVFNCADQLFAADVRKELSFAPEVLSKLDLSIPSLDCERPSDSLDPEAYGIKLYNMLVRKFPHLTAMGETTRYIREAYPFLEAHKFYNPKEDILLHSPELFYLVQHKISLIRKEAVLEYNRLSEKVQPSSSDAANPDRSWSDSHFVYVQS